MKDELKVVPSTNVGEAARAARELLWSRATPVPTELFEVEPYHAIKENVPVNTYKNKSPLTGTIASVKRIVGPNAVGEVCCVAH